MKRLIHSSPVRWVLVGGMLLTQVLPPWGLGSVVRAQPPAPATQRPGDDAPPAEDAGQQPDAMPVLRLRPEGTRGVISRLRFSRDGRTLYAAGDNKRVDAWTRQGADFVRDHALTMRSPLGPGPKGVLRDLAATPDDRFVAVGGIGSLPAGDDADFRTDGLMFAASAMGRRMLGHLGTVTLFDREQNQRRGLKSHLGYILAIDAVQTGPGQPPLLAVLGNDEVPMQCDGDEIAARSFGRSLRIIDAATGKLLRRWDVPQGGLQHRVVAWLDQPGDASSLRAAVVTGNGSAGGVELFDLQSDQSVAIENKLAIAMAMLRSPAGERSLLVTSQTGLVRLDPNTGAVVQTIDLSATLAPGEFTFQIAAPDDARGLDANGLIAITTENISQAATRHQLRLVDLNAGTVVGGTINLGGIQNPVVAISPDGATVAATADVTSGLVITSTQSLRRGNTQPDQSLRPDFIPITRAALTQNADRTQGLRLETRSAQGQTLPYDLVDNELTPRVAGTWNSFGTPLTFSRPGDDGVVTPSGVINGQRLKLPTIQTSLPAVGVAINVPSVGNRPIAAIGFVEYEGNGSTRLQLVDGSTGETLRELSGHEQLITSAEFSRSGNRLTTVSADGVVCVWSLDDLKGLVDQRGTIRGVKFCHDGKDLLVTEIDDASREMTLAVGDRILGVVKQDGSEVQTFLSVARMLRELSLRPVGARVVFRVVRGGRNVDATVTLTQATDERKPLFSLILTRENAGAPLSWMAWSPHGPFDASDDSIQSRAGWHFNDTSDLGPIRFAPLSEYKNDFFGKGLVDSLLKTGRVPAVWPPAVVPTISGVITDADGADRFARGRAFTLPDGRLRAIRFLIDDVPPMEIDSVSVSTPQGDQWQLTRMASEPNIWETETVNNLVPGSRTNLRVSVRGNRLPGGEVLDDWLIDVPPPPVVVKPVPPVVDPVPEPTAEPTTPEPTTPAPPTPQPLPEIQLTSHSESSVLITPAQWDGDLSLTLVGRVGGESVDESLEYLVDVDGKLVPLAGFKTNGSRFKGNIELPIGRHLVALVVRRGEETARSETVAIERVDLPEIEQWVARINDGKTAQAAAIVRSSQPLEQRQIRVLVEGIGFDHMPISITPVADKTDRYRVNIDKIPLTAGSNELQCSVIDSRGQARPPEIARVEHEAEETKFRLLVDLKVVAAVKEDSIDFDVRVTSRDDVTLQLFVDGIRQLIGRPREIDTNTYVTTATVQLQAGANRIVVTAIAQDGQTVQSIHDISRIQPPTRIKIDRVTDSRGNVMEVSSSARWLRADGISGSAEITITGHVSLGGGEARPSMVRGWVNGFLQSKEALRMEADPLLAGDERPFEISVTLTAANSIVRFDLPELPESEDSTAIVSIECANPSLDQRLHLLTVNTEVGAEQRLAFEEVVFQAFQIEDGTAPAFSKVFAGAGSYPTLTGNISSGRIRRLIQECKLKTRGGNGRNDVVMFYFQGEELRNVDGKFGLVTDDILDGLFDNKSMITSDYLGEQFRDMRGAHLMLLDVRPHEQSQSAKVAGDPRHPMLGVMRLQRGQTGDESNDPPMLNQIRTFLPQVERLIDLADKMRDRQPRESFVFRDAIPTDLANLKINAAN